MPYNITHTDFRDIYGKFLWSEPLKEESRLYRLGETFPEADVTYRVERMALVENVQHVNVQLIVEDIIITEPHL